MKKILLQQVVAMSYVENALDSTTVSLIATHLNRRDLKQYIRALKAQERKSHVIITSAQPVTGQQKALEEIFTGKKFIYETNSDLLIGMKIHADDIIYELNLKNMLEQIGSHIYE